MNILGKFFVGLVSGALLCADPGITLSLKDTRSMAAGDVFRVQVALDDMSNLNLSDLSLKLPHGAELIGREVTVLFGSQQRHLVTYKIRVDEQGTYDIGPASCTYQGAVYTSGSVRIKIAPESAQVKVPSVSFKLDVARAFIGQKVPCTITCVLPQHAQIVNYHAPVEDGFVLEVASHQDVVQTDPYKIVTYHGYFYPKRSGDISLEQLAFSYYQQESSLFGRSFISAFFGTTLMVQAPVQHVQILDLPKNGQPVHGVGAFTKVEAIIDSTELQVGEASVFKIRITGVGNHKGVIHPELRLGTHLKSYISRHDDLQQDPPVHILEYILQPITQGKVIIPSQSFTFFNPVTEQYHTLTTQPLSVSVKAGVTVPAVVFESGPEKVSPVYTMKTISKPFVIPSRYFWFLVFLPLIVCIVLSLLQFFSRWATSLYRRRMRRTIFRRVGKRIALLSEHKTGEVYHLVKTAFSTYFEEPEMSEQDIEYLMRTRGFSQDEISHWLSLYYIMLADAGYHSARYTTLSWREWYQEVSRWCLLFDKRFYAHGISVLPLVLLFTISSLSAVARNLAPDKIEIYQNLRESYEYADESDRKALKQEIDAFVIEQGGQPPLLEDTWHISLKWYGIYQILFLIALWGAMVMLYYANTFIRSTGALMFLCVAALLVFTEYQRSQPVGFVAKTPCVLRIGPGEQYPILKSIGLLQEVEIRKKESFWYYVHSRTDDGWVSADTIVIISK